MLQKNGMTGYLEQHTRTGWILGILFTMLFAVAGTELATLPWINRIGAMLTAIILAIIYRNTLGYPENLKTGIQYTSRTILRLAIVLYGFKLNIQTVLSDGLPLLAHDILTIILAISATMLLAKLFKADRGLSLLLGIGTGVCGAAAIAAVSPILQADDEDTAISAGIIALAGTLFALGYAFLQPYLGLSPVEYGIFSGISLHEIAHVAAAAAPAGTEALSVGLLAKLGRVFLLIPLSFILSYWMSRKGQGNGQKAAPFPWFLLGFVATSVIGSYVHLPKTLLNDISTTGSFLLAAGMVGLGLNVHTAHLRSRALRPLGAMLGASVILSFFSYFTLRLF